MTIVENETCLKVKKLIFDNCVEYENTKFKRFCYENKIKLQRTVPRMPQLNDTT